MSILEVTGFSLTTSLGRYIVPYIKISEQSGHTPGSFTFAPGDSLAGSLPACVLVGPAYYSVIANPTTQEQDAFKIIGAVGEYMYTINTPTTNLYAISTKASNWVYPGTSNTVNINSNIYWRYPNQGSQKYINRILCIVEGSDQIPHLSTIELYESRSGTENGTFSISTPDTGEFGNWVWDVVASCTMTHLPVVTVSSNNAAITADMMANPYVPGGGVPYEGGGTSDVGGGTGNFDGTSVDVDFASLPSLSAVDTGFITLYNPSLTQLKGLASYMWSSLFDEATFKKLFADPMQAILGLSIVPGPVPSSGSQHVKIGNIDSGVNMSIASSQYIDIDCGSLNIEEFWGAYLDYEPYTKAEIYLPFIGVHQIAVDDIMNKTVAIKYHIDLLSGGCACEIKCGGSVLYTFVGSCAISVPITGNDWTNLINGVLTIAGSIGSMVATGGASAPAAAGEIASAVVNSLKPSIEKSGSVSGSGGLLAGKVPVLILTRPRQALPERQYMYTGYPAFITRNLGSVTGYTEVHSIRLSGIDGTDSEIDEIEELLKGGVIL